MSASVSAVVGGEVVSLEQRGVHIGMNGIEQEGLEKRDVDFRMIGIEKQDQQHLIEVMEVAMDEESATTAERENDDEAEND